MNYKDVNDYELVYLIRENDENSYNIMFEKYKPIIYKLASKYYNCYPKSGYDMDDFIQEGMFGLNEALKIFDFNENNMFYTVALLCIKREMIRCIVNSTRQKNIVLNNSISLYSVEDDSEFGLIDVLYNKNDITDCKVIDCESSKNILDLRYYLNDRQSQVFELKLNGFSNMDIATLLDIKYKDVDNSFRSLKKILMGLKNMV